MNSEDLGWLLLVARAGSLSAAAKSRGVAVSTVARRLDALEARLKLRLVDRRRDGVRLTADGERIAAVAADVVTGVEQIDRTAAALRSGEQQRVLVTATEYIVSDILLPALPRLQALSPALQLALQSQIAVVSLAGREADLAVRMSRPEGASLVAKKLAAIPLGLFASETYLAGRDPQRLNLAVERLLIYDDTHSRLPEVSWLDPLGLASAVALRTNSVRGLLIAALAGSGIALLPRTFAIQAGLVEVASPITLPSRTPWVVTHTDLRQRPEIRMVHKWIVEAFRKIG